MRQVQLLMGLPASGKSALAKSYVAQGYTVLNRDSVGGLIEDLLPAFEAALANPDCKIVLDNLFLTVDGRAPFIALANKHGAEIHCSWMQTSFEDAQVNVLNRMWDRYGEVFLTPDEIKNSSQAKADPNMFPVAAMFAHRKKLDGDKKNGIVPGKPTAAEGFKTITKVPFTRTASNHSGKAIILDYDGTLRRDCKELGYPAHYPLSKDQVQVLPGRREVLQKYIDQGYILLGISNQSGIGKGEVTKAAVDECFVETNRQLGLDIPFHYCGHYDFPVKCYCRKPQAGLGIYVARKYNLNPALCYYVGDMTTDRSFAERCGFQFVHADDFFKAGV